MTNYLAAIQQLPGRPDLAERDQVAARAVASGLQDAKAGTTRRFYASAWQQFVAWAEADDHSALPTTPQSVALYLEVWPESHWPGFALRKADVFQSDMA